MHEIALCTWNSLGLLNSCYRSCAHGQGFLCLQLHADEAKGSIQWKMTLKPRLCVKTADNCDVSHCIKIKRSNECFSYIHSIPLCVAVVFYHLLVCITSHQKGNRKNRMNSCCSQMLTYSLVCLLNDSLLGHKNGSESSLLDNRTVVLSLQDRTLWFVGTWH